MISSNGLMIRALQQFPSKLFQTITRVITRTICAFVEHQFIFISLSSSSFNHKHCNIKISTSNYSLFKF